MIGHWICYGKGSSKKTPSLRWGSSTIGAALSKSVLKCLSIVSILFLSACEDQILHDLSETEANRVISRFSGTAIAPSKVSQSDGRWAIAVHRGEAVSALSFLESHRVLSSRSGIAAKGSKVGLVPSREEQWFSYQRAVAQSIEETLNSLGGVLEAHVHVNLPEHDPLLGRKRETGGTGSVLLVVDERFGSRDEDISALVTGAAGLPAGSVTVLRSVATRSSESEPDTVAPPVVPTNPTTETRISDVVPWASPELACTVLGAFACGAVGLVAVRRRGTRKRTRFSLPVESHHES